MQGRGGNDVLCGGTGADGLVGSTGDDALSGDLGDDVLNGGSGDDRLLGLLGTDTCLQGPGTGAERGCERFDLQPAFPIRATFYYPWFPETWGGIEPFTNYSPSLGLYDSGDPSVIRAHLRAMLYGGIEVGISSWWGRGESTDERVPRLLRAATDTTFRWTLYYEREGYGDPAVDRIRADLRYIASRYASDQSFLRRDGRFVLFVFSADDTGCGVVNRWARANTVGAYLVLEAFPGYLECPVQPDGWHLYGAAAAEAALLPYSFSVTPGFWKAGEEPFLVRDPARWDQNVSNMLGSGARWQLVTTFNEWGEGTSVESAEEWASASGFGSYLDALHDATPSTPDPVPNIALGMPTTATGSYGRASVGGGGRVLDSYGTRATTRRSGSRSTWGARSRSAGSPCSPHSCRTATRFTECWARPAPAIPTNRCMSSRASPPTISGSTTRRRRPGRTCASCGSRRRRAPRGSHGARSRSSRRARRSRSSVEGRFRQRENGHAHGDAPHRGQPFA
jgi:hypothetical protein